ncbi:hypothetical protein FKB34_03205 [Glycocaulis profundi]|nr:hypothetical protein FKB34_03205 [Glycocaulis profundi]
MSDEIQDIEVERIFLYEENPRHEPLETQEAVIAQLCQDEQVYELAVSICQAGTNPLELVGLVEKEGTGKRGTKKAYEVWEGNRRICAIQLLNDPEKAPAKDRPRFEKLTENYTPILKVKGVVFDDHQRLKFWMSNIHGGAQGGAGRKQWGAVEKTRATGAPKNAVALALLERAKDYGIVTSEQWKGKLTTLTRYVGNSQMKSALGLDTSDVTTLKSDLTEEDFIASLKTLVSDLLSGELSSRHNKTEIDRYARRLPEKAGATTKRATSRSISNIGAPEGAPTFKAGSRKPGLPKPSKPAKPSQPTKIRPSQELQDALDRRGNPKLQQIYYDICEVSAVEHPLLVAVGAWIFIECLTAETGRSDNRPFKDYYGNHFLEKLGWAGKERGVIRYAIERLSRGGNDTKHHALAGSFDAQQTITDMALVTPVLVATLKHVEGN